MFGIYPARPRSQFRRRPACSARVRNDARRSSSSRTSLPFASCLRRRSTRAGYKVHEARNGQEALKVFDQHGDAIDLLLTDLRMPYMGGIELAQTLRARRKTLKLICVSGYPGSGETELPRTSSPSRSRAKTSSPKCAKCSTGADPRAVASVLEIAGAAARSLLLLHGLADDVVRCGGTSAPAQNLPRTEPFTIGVLRRDGIVIPFADVRRSLLDFSLASGPPASPGPGFVGGRSHEVVGQGRPARDHDALGDRREPRPRSRRGARRPCASCARPRVGLRSNIRVVSAGPAADRPVVSQGRRRRVGTDCRRADCA